MKDTKKLVLNLIKPPGVSGREAAIREDLRRRWEPLVDEIRVNRLGSLYGLKYGCSSSREGKTSRQLSRERPRLILSAHMDTIGLMVSGFHGPLLRVTRVGGADLRVLPGQLVRVHGRETVTGVVIRLPEALLPEDASSQALQWEHMMVDVGLSEKRLRELFQVGDVITFDQEPLILGEHHLAGPGLDNRASLACLTLVLEKLQGRQIPWDLYLVATIAEEERGVGARTSGFDLDPSLAVVLDVTFGRGPGTQDHQAYPLGGGITLGWGPSIHPGLYRRFRDLAEKEDIPWTREPLPVRSGTDADHFQVAASGVPTMLISLPLRYMHTPVEMIDLRDVEAASQLLLAFLTDQAWDLGELWGKME